MNHRSYAIREGQDWVHVEGSYVVKGGHQQLVDDPENQGAMILVTSDLPLPVNWRDIYSEVEIHDLGFREIAPPDPHPPGCHIGALTVKDEGGLPKWAYETTPMDLEVAQKTAFAQLAAARWAASQMLNFGDEHGGARTQAQPAIAIVTAILAQRARTDVDADQVQNYKLADGVFRSWTEAHFRMFLNMILNHVQVCIDLEADATQAVLEAPDAVVIADIVSAVPWP